MSRTSMIKVIHIARRDLHLDDDTYRSLLGAVVPGKSSCREMTIIELQNVIQALEAKGFKSKPLRCSKRRMSAPSDVSLKIRAIWKTMFNEGFIRDGSDIALDRFVQRQTRIRNGGAGVSSLEWLRADAEDNLLESLKQWHIREMKKAMLAHHARLPENPVTGDESRDYDTICSAYAVAARRWKK
ncbi:gp16 family protein [Klebsiella pneumoniae]|uniref:gp16 family protein n=1 Tax=Klebsiella pneumoniae TaxID=573 RepID=UPI0023B335E5|nr:regulatory protein GemA [Klebsiella pneumoniae]EMB2530956.1 regulatory protein GemA [Klebsiella pneumoniae]